MIRDSDFDMSITSPGEIPEEDFNTSDADKQRAQGIMDTAKSPQGTRAATPHTLEAILIGMKDDIQQIAEKVDHLEEEQAKRLVDLERMYQHVVQLEQGTGTDLLAQKKPTEPAALPNEVLDASNGATPPGFVVPTPEEPQIHLSEQ